MFPDDGTNVQMPTASSHYNTGGKPHCPSIGQMLSIFPLSVLLLVQGSSHNITANNTDSSPRNGREMSEIQSENGGRERAREVMSKLLNRIKLEAGVRYSR